MSHLMGSLIRLLVVLQLAQLAAPMVVAAQQPPDFSGRWTLVPDQAPTASGRPPRIPATAGSGWGHEFSIAQDARKLTVERAQFVPYDMQPAMRFEYALDGSESRTVINMGRGPQEQTSRALWKGASLVIATRHGAGTPSAAEITHVFTLDQSTGLLTIETTRPAAGSAVPSTSVTRYRRIEDKR